MLRFQLKNIVLTPATAVGVLGLFLFMLISIYPNPYNDVVYNYQYATQLGYGSYFIPVAAVLPVCFYLQQFGSQRGTQFSLIRSSLPRYTGSTIFGAVLSGMVVTLSAFILFTFSCCFLVHSAEGPAYFGDGLMENSDAEAFYGRFLAHPFVLYLIMGAIYTVNGAIWPVISLFCFTLVQNQYIVVAIPLIFKVVVGIFAQLAGLFFLDPSQLQLFGGIAASWYGGGIPYMLLYMGIVILLCSGGWGFRIYRQVRHG
jgi:hypothetical protein